MVFVVRELLVWSVARAVLGFSFSSLYWWTFIQICVCLGGPWFLHQVQGPHRIGARLVYMFSLLNLNKFNKRNRLQHETRKHQGCFALFLIRIPNCHAIPHILTSVVSSSCTSLPNIYYLYSGCLTLKTKTQRYSCRALCAFSSPKAIISARPS